MQFMTRIRRRPKGTISYYFILLLSLFYLVFCYFLPSRYNFYFIFYIIIQFLLRGLFLNGFIFYNFNIFFLPPRQNNDLTWLLGFITSHVAISCVRSEQRGERVSLEIPAKSGGQSSKSTMTNSYMCSVVCATDGF